MSAYTFFYNGPFSNWYPAKFVYKGINFTCSEQAMMWEKAMVFGDTDVADAILMTDDPYEQKQLGREIKGYVDEVWAPIRESIVFNICKEKFTQNPILLDHLLGTDKTLLVEASPVDRIWGIGLSEADPRAKDPSKWRGKNLLGKVLTDLRGVLE